MERNSSLDIFKLILAFFVVGIHCQLANDKSEFTSFFLNEGLFRLAVPTFILISGYYFSNINTGKQLLNWCLRILMLFLFWTIVYVPLWIDEPKWYIKLIILINGYGQLWYIIHMLIAGLIFFYLKKIKNFNPLYFAIVLFLIGCIIQYSAVYTHNETINVFFRFVMMGYRNFAFVCLPFFSIGYYIRSSDLKLNKMLLLISIFLLIVEISFNYVYARAFPNPIFDILFSLLLVTPMLFIAVKDYKISIARGKEISMISSSIYFSHLWILRILSDYGIQESVVKWIFTIAIAILFSFPIIYINSRLKYKIL